MRQIFSAVVKVTTSVFLAMSLPVNGQDLTEHSIVRELPMPLVAPLFLESEGYSSTLYLVNELNVAIQADISLYDMSGKELLTKHLYIDPNGQRSTSVKHILSESGIYSGIGSIEVVAPQHANAILGQLSITRTGMSKAYLDEELFMSDPNASNKLISVIDSPENSPIIALTNTSSIVAQLVKINCTASVGSNLTKTISLQPKQTQLVRACSKGEDLAFSPDEIDAQFLDKVDVSGLSGQRVAGISVTSDGPSGEIAAFGFVEHSDSYGRYFSAANFADPKLLRSSASVYVGVPIGNTDLLPATTYVPQIALTNFSDKEQTASVFLNSTDNQTITKRQVATLIIPAKSSHFAQFDRVAGNALWQNSFLVEASGNPGDVFSKMMFKGHGPVPNVELMGKDGSDPHTAGGHPWSVRDGMTSTLLIFNHSKETRETMVRVGSGTSLWTKMYDLKPGETKAISVNQLISSRVLDMNQHSIPSTTTQGELAWWAPNDGPSEVSGRLVQIDNEKSMARNFSCGDIILLCGVFPSPANMDLGFLTQQPMIVQTQYCVYQQIPSSCQDNGSYTSAVQSASFTWRSGDPTIARITSSTIGPSSTWSGVTVGNTRSYLQSTSSRSRTLSCSSSGSVHVFQCVPPDGEISNAVRQTVTGPGSPVATDFVQTLKVVGNDDGDYVSEQENGAGVDSCYFKNGDGIPPLYQSQVEGGWSEESLLPTQKVPSSHRATGSGGQTRLGIAQRWYDTTNCIVLSLA